MKPQILILLILPLSAAFAQNSPSPGASAIPKSLNAHSASPAPAPDAAELTKLLKDFLAGASRNDLAMHERFWADDLIYTASAGRRLGKQDTLREVRAEAASTPGPQSTVFTAEDIRIQQYGDMAIVAFRLVGTTEKDKTVENYLNTGTFLKRDGKWQAVSWQATKMPSPDKESR